MDMKHGDYLYFSKGSSQTGKGTKPMGLAGIRDVPLVVQIHLSLLNLINFFPGPSFGFLFSDCWTFSKKVIGEDTSNAIAGVFTSSGKTITASAKASFMLSLAVRLPCADRIQWCGRSGASWPGRVFKLPNTHLSFYSYALPFELTFD